MAATVTETEWGYSITGATGATRVPDTTEFPGVRPRIRIKQIMVSGANDATVTFTSLAGGADVSCCKIKIETAEDDCTRSRIFFGERGVWFTDFKLTLGASGTLVYIYTV